MFKGAILSQDFSVTESYFERSIWDSKSNAHSFLQPKKKKKKPEEKQLTLMQVCFQLHGHKCFVTNGRNSHFF